MPGSSINVLDLLYEYPDGTPALCGVNLRIAANEFIALIGQNGSGKTTLAKCLSGLLRPTHGAVFVGDIDTRQRGIVKKLVTRVGYVFQNPDHQLFNNTVFKEIAYGPRNLGLPEPVVAARVEESARAAGIAPALFETHPFFLAKVMRQRIAIASILAMQPQMIIVDEPTTGQDVRQSLEIMNFLQRLWQEQGHTIIIITHEMAIVARYAQRVIAMAGGRVSMDGSPRAVFSRPAELLACGVRPPQATQLAHALGGAGIRGDILGAGELSTELGARIRERRRAGTG